MVHAIILLCSAMVPHEACNEKTALDVAYRDLPFGILAMAAQVEMASDPRGMDWRHYVVVRQVRPE